MLVFSDTAHTHQLLQAPTKLKQGTALYGGDNGYAAQARCPRRLDPNEFGQVELEIKPNVPMPVAENRVVGSRVAERSDSLNVHFQN